MAKVFCVDCGRSMVKTTCKYCYRQSIGKRFKEGRDYIRGE